MGFEKADVIRRETRRPGVLEAVLDAGDLDQAKRALTMLSSIKAAL